MTVLSYQEPAQERRGRVRYLRLSEEALLTNFGHRHVVHWQLPRPRLMLQNDLLGTYMHDLSSYVMTSESCSSLVKVLMFDKDSRLVLIEASDTQLPEAQ